jgi:ribonuclease Z
VKNSTIEIYSKGLYSSWCYHKPTRTLFDCGEGFASYQGNYAYGVERVMISHGHGDHVLGLPSFIGCRNSARGDREKPLEVYYPWGDKLVESVREFVMKRNDNLHFDVRWHPIAPGHRVEITPKIFITSHANKHQKGDRFTLGYRINEHRTRLLDEYQGKDIRALLASGVKREDISMSYDANIFAYALDAYYADGYLLKNAEMAVMDCTFIRKGDRDDNTHYTLDEAVDDAISCGVKRVIAAHFSPRYTYPEIKAVVEKVNTRCGNKVTPVYHNQVAEI